MILESSLSPRSFVDYQGKIQNDQENKTLTKAIDSSKAYRNLTSRMDLVIKHKSEPHPWNELDSKIASLPNLQENISALLNAIDQADWDSAILMNNLYPYYALAAFKIELISLEKFGTLMLYWSVNQHHSKTDIKIINLFEDEVINKEALGIIEETLNSSQETILNPKFVNNELHDFFQRMRAKPLMEQCFFSVPDIRSPSNVVFFEKEKVDPNLNKNRSISHAIEDAYGFNVFCRFKLAERDMRMIPSLGMMQAFLDVKHLEPVKINPRIGVSTNIGIENNGLQKTRDLALPFPDTLIPLEADEFLAAEGYEFTYHDFFHSQIASYIPATHQRAIIETARLIKSMKKTLDNSLDKIFLNEIYRRLIDMEHSSYLFFLSDPSTAFWLAINESNNHVAMGLARKKFLAQTSSEQPNEDFETFFAAIYLKELEAVNKFLEQTKFLSIYTNAICKNKFKLKSEYKIEFRPIKIQAEKVRKYWVDNLPHQSEEFYNNRCQTEFFIHMEKANKIFKERK